MKEGKTTKTTAKKKTYNNSRNHTSRDVKETPKVREVKAQENEENFLEEDGDKRLIVFIAIAILVIVGTVIGLLVGCQKEKTPEPEKPTDDVVVPDDKKDNKKEEVHNYDYEKPLPVVRKVTKKKTTTKEDTTEGDGEGDNEKTSYNVTFIINGTSEVVSVEDGSEAEKYEPTGYTGCKYYTDEEMTNEYEFGSVSEDANIYMSCELIEYTINYDVEAGNPTTYTIEDADTTLSSPESDNGVFDGWYTEPENGTKVTTLNKEIVSYANDSNVISLYARFTTNNDDVVSDEENTEEETTVDRNETTEPIVGEGSTDETGENEEGQGTVAETPATENEDGNDKVTDNSENNTQVPDETTDPTLEDKNDEGTEGQSNDNTGSEPSEPAVENPTSIPETPTVEAPASEAVTPVVETPVPEVIDPTVEEPTEPVKVKEEDKTPVVETTTPEVEEESGE